MNKLPIYNAEIKDERDGIIAISFVEEPAVESNFMLFGKQIPLFFANEEKKNILGVIMRADFPIYRRDEDGNEFYVTYSSDTIAKMAQKYFVSGAVNTTSINHNGEVLDGVSLVQWYIKDTNKGIAPNGFDDVKDGSLFAEFHIENEELWTACKDGTFKGFSLEGYFTTEKTNLKSDKMENKIMQKVRELLVKLAKVTTDKGELSYEGDLEVGTEVVDANGVAVSDGDYKLEDGKIIVIKDGKVETIKEAVNLEGEEKAESLTLGQKRDLLTAKLSEILGADVYAWVCDLNDTTVFYGKGGAYYSAPYTIDETAKTIEINVAEEKQASQSWVSFQEQVPAEEPTVSKADFDALKADFDALKAVVDELIAKVDELKKPVEEPIESKFSRMSAGKIETLQQKLKGLK